MVCLLAGSGYRGIDGYEISAAEMRMRIDDL
jgi:hypothetical protein